jgi:protein phosphatase
VQLTRDQSLVNQLIEAGQLTEEEAETFEHNNIILQALGTADTVQVDLTYCELQRGDVLMLCSDGLSGMVRFDDIREVMRSTPDPVDACKVLIERANQAGGHDNITVVVAAFDGEGLIMGPQTTEPLKYRKYALPEEPSDTEPNRRSLTDTGGRPQMPHTAGSLAPQGMASTMVFSSQPPGASAALAQPAPRIRSGRPGPYEEERIEIPGTHVPPWVVIVIVVGVILVLAATAFLFLR